MCEWHVSLQIVCGDRSDSSLHPPWWDIQEEEDYVGYSQHGAALDTCHHHHQHHQHASANGESVNSCAPKSSIRRFVITEKEGPYLGLLLVESGYYRFHI